jgi:hypothetical protein
MKLRNAALCILFVIGGAPVNLSKAQGVFEPVLDIYPHTGDFFGVELGSSWDITFTIRNIGGSVLKIKNVEITGDAFSLVDTNNYPFEVVADTSFNFPVENSGPSLKFIVNFAPADTGAYHGKITITHGFWEDDILEIPLSGVGVSCQYAIEAVKGENWSPKLPIWYKYTADKFSIVEVNSCHPNQVNTASNLYALLHFDVYLGCNGPWIHPWDFYDCPYDQNSFPVSYPMHAGETIYIYWPQWVGSAPYDTEGFYFNINVWYPIDGDVCESAIPLNLPVVNHFGNTRGFNDDYDTSPCSPYYNYIDGNEIVYTIYIPEDGYLIGDILGSYASIHVLDKCPKYELPKDHCKAYANGREGGQFQKRIEAGSYYVIVSNWAPPQAVDFLLNLSWQSTLGIDDNDLERSLNVYPNPSQDVLTISLDDYMNSKLLIELINSTGQIVYRKEATSSNRFHDLVDIKPFDSGVYFLRIRSEKELTIKKVVIE